MGQVNYKMEPDKWECHENSKILFVFMGRQQLHKYRMWFLEVQTSNCSEIHTVLQKVL